LIFVIDKKRHNEALTSHLKYREEKREQEKRKRPLCQMYDCVYLSVLSDVLSNGEK